MRCLKLANYFKASGFNCVFISNNLEGNILKKVELYGHKAIYQTDRVYKQSPRINSIQANYQEWLPFAQEEDANLFIECTTNLNYQFVVIDHYSLDQTWEKIIKCARNPKILVIDDLCNRKHSCDLLIDYTLNRDEEEYKDLVPHKCELLLGAKYFFNDLSFLKEREKIFFKKTNDLCKKILVNMGGADVNNFTLKILQQIESDNFFKSLSFSVLINEASKTYNDVKLIAKKNENIKIINFSDNISSIYANHDLCIGAAGVSSYERASLGLPTFLIQTAKNQFENFTKFCNLNITKGLSPKDFETNFLKKLKELIKNPLEREELKINSLKNVNCIGQIQILKNFLKIDPFTLKHGSEKEIISLYNWQTYPGNRKFARNPETPTLEEHRSWYKSMQLSNHHQLYFLYFENIPLGYARIDFNDKSEISIMTSFAFQGLGIGKEILNKVRSQTDKDLFAFINPNNKASIKIFTKCGYRYLKDNWYKSEQKSP